MPKTSYQIEVSKNGKYIQITVKTAVTIPLALQIIKDTNHLLESDKVDRFLVDLREAPNVASVISNYEFFYRELPALGISRRIHAAILANGDDNTHEFPELVAKNAGYHMQVFHDEEAARRWLEQ